MPDRWRKEAIRLFRSWVIALAVLLALGIGGNVVLAQRVATWRDQNPVFHWTRADKLIYAKEYDEALRELRIAMSLAPNRFEPYYIEGHLYYARREWDKAAEMYRRAEMLNPDLTTIKERLFWCLMNAKRYKEAAEYGSRLLSLSQVSPEIPKYLASAWLQVGDPQKAIALLEQELEKSPKNIELMNRLVAAYRQAGRHQDADKLTVRMAEAQAERDQILSETR